MKPVDLSHTFQRIFETVPSLGEVFRSNLRILREYDLPSLLVLPDDLIYRLEGQPTLYFAAPFNVGLNVWSANNCKLLFRSQHAVGTLQFLMEIQTAERTMFSIKGQGMRGCFEIAGQPAWSNVGEHAFRVWPDTFQHTKVFGVEEDAQRYVDILKTHRMGN